MALEVGVVMETPCAVAICSFFTGVYCFTISREWVHIVSSYIRKYVSSYCNSFIYRFYI